MELGKQYKQFIKEFERKIYPQKRNLLFLCIGSNKVIGDSFGPLVGTFLQEKIKTFSNISIKGNMEETIDIDNIEKEVEKYLRKKYLIIVIDSAITDKGKIGEIFITKAPMILGEGVGKEGIEIGDYSIKGTVCYEKKDEQKNLKQLSAVPEKIVFQLAHMVGEGIYQVITKEVIK